MSSSSARPSSSACRPCSPSTGDRAGAARERRGRGARALGRADRRPRRCPGDRDPRADAAAGVARAGIHGPHPRRARVRAHRRRGGRRVSAVSGASQLPRLDHRGRVTQWHVFLSEWTKLRSVRSSAWSLAAAFVFTIALSDIAAAVVVNHWPHMQAHDRAEFHPLDVAQVGVQLAQLAIGVLGVLLITAEYSTGMIRASMTAVPKRLPVLLGKAVVYALVTFALTAPASLGAFVTSQAILSGRDIETTLTAPGVPRAVVGAALYLTVIGLFGLGLGAIVRNTAGGIAAFAGIMFVLPPLMNVLPSTWNAAAPPSLPLQAGERIMALHRGNQLAPWTGFGFLCVYTAAALLIAAVLLRRRDV